MSSIIAVFLVDTAATLDLLITPPQGAPPSSGPTLLQLAINNTIQGTPELVAQQHSSGTLALSTLQTRVLQPGVYFFAADGEIRYDVTNGKCRSVFLNGKNPVSPPPPPAPAGTPLKTWESVYTAMFSDIVTTVSDAPGRQWMVISLEERAAS